MKRIALFLAMISIVVATLFYAFGEKVCVIFGIGLLTASIICYILRKNIAGGLRVTVVLLLGAMFCVFLMLYNHFIIQRAEALDGTSAEVYCVVTEEPTVTSEYKLLPVKSINHKGYNSAQYSGHNFTLFINSSSSAFGADVGDVIKADITFYKNDDLYKRINYIDKNHISARTTNAEIVGYKTSLYSFCVSTRRNIRNVLSERFTGDKEALLSGLVLGDISKMSDSLYNDFISCGTCHITAVSGMNIGALCMMIFTLLSFLLGKRRAALLSLAPVVIIVAVTGLTASGIRAGIMCAIAFLGIAMSRKPDALNSLGFAIVMMLLSGPFYVLDLGFQLSCSATLGVIIFSKYSIKLVEKLKNIKVKLVKHILLAIILTFIESIGAVLFTLPFQIIEFGRISLIAPVSSVLVCGAAVYVLLLSVPAILATFIPFLNFLANILFFIIEILLDYIIICVRLLADVPFSSINFGSVMATVWIGLSLALIGIWFLLNRVGGVRVISIMVSTLLVLSLWLDFWASKSIYEVAVLPVGDGFCTVINHKGSCVVVGCGDDDSDYYVLENYFTKHNINSVEAVLLPTNDYSATGGLNKVLSNIKPKLILAPEGVGNYFGLGEDLKQLKYNEALSVAFLTLMPIDNGNGCVYRISCDDVVFSVGCTGYNVPKGQLIGLKFAVSGMVLPENEISKNIIVSCRNRSSKYDYSEYGDNRLVFTENKQIVIKFKQGKGLSLYEEQR